MFGRLFFQKMAPTYLCIISLPGPPPLPPPKPSHLSGKLNNNNVSYLHSTNSITPSIIPKSVNAVPSTPVNNNTVISVAKTENTNSNDTVSFQEEIEPQLDPKKCEIKPGKETTIEITKERMGLGLSIVGGSDTPLVNMLLF